jgi:hypothetical protein
MTLNDEGQLGVRIVEDGVVRFVPGADVARHGQWRLAVRPA